MPGNERQAGRHVAFDDVEIGAANAARLDPDRDLPGSGTRLRDLADFESAFYTLGDPA